MILKANFPPAQLKSLFLEWNEDDLVGGCRPFHKANKKGSKGFLHSIHPRAVNDTFKSELGSPNYKGLLQKKTHFVNGCVKIAKSKSPRMNE